MTNSCKDCTKRHPGCHGECEDYKEFRAKIDYTREQKSKEREIHGYAIHATQQSIKRRGGK